MYEYADGKILEFGTRGGYTNPEDEVEIGNIFYGTKGYLWIDARRPQVAVVPSGQEGEGPRREHSGG